MKTDISNNMDAIQKLFLIKPKNKIVYSVALFDWKRADVDQYIEYNKYLSHDFKELIQNKGNKKY